MYQYGFDISRRPVLSLSYEVYASIYSQLESYPLNINVEESTNSLCHIKTQLITQIVNL
jgi:hypothetical protein